MKINQLYIIGRLLIAMHIIGFTLSYIYIGGIEAIIGTTLSGMVSLIIYHITRETLRINYINDYQFPSIVIKKFMEQYDQIEIKEIDYIKNALKQFFMIYSIAVSKGRVPKKGFIMPSKIVDELWHNFMLDSLNYEKFCKLAFGRILHHKPGQESKGNKNLNNLTNYPEELKNTYRHINHLKNYQSVMLLNGIPLLFAIDAYFNVDNGYYYNDMVLANIASVLEKPSATSDSSGCSGIYATDTGSCSSDSGSDGGSCGGGCGGGGD